MSAVQFDRKPLETGGENEASRLGRRGYAEHVRARSFQLFHASFVIWPELAPGPAWVPACAGTTTGQAFQRRGGRWLMGPGNEVEAVEQGGDAGLSRTGP